MKNIDWVNELGHVGLNGNIYWVTISFHIDHGDKGTDGNYGYLVFANLLSQISSQRSY